jgi:hypothetical protein
MPDQDVVLVVKKITIMKKLTIELDPYQGALVAKKIQGVVYDNSSKSLPAELEMVEGNEINLYVRFEDDGMKLDESHFYGQIIPERIYEAGELDPKPGIINDNDKELYQQVSFKMPDSNTTLYLRWTERVYTITVDYPISIMSSAKYSIDRGGATIEGYFNNELRCYTKDKVAIDFELYEGFILDYIKSKYTIENENNGNLTQSQIKYPSNNDEYFEKTENKNNISIKATIRKKNITIVLKEKFDGIKKLICPGINSLSTGEIQLLKSTKPARLILWGADGSSGAGGNKADGGSPRSNGGSAGSVGGGFVYISTDFQFGIGKIVLNIINGAGGGGGGGNISGRGGGGGSGGALAFITYNSLARQIIAFGGGGSGGGGGGVGGADSSAGGGGHGAGGFDNNNQQPRPEGLNLTHKKWLAVNPAG